MTVATIDFDAEQKAIFDRLEAEYNRRIQQPYVRIWDGSWVLRGVAAVFYSAEFTEKDSDTGMGQIVMPADYYLSKWIADEDGRTTLNVHITVDKDGVRWSGRMDTYEYDLKEDGTSTFTVNFKHDYEELKHILVWANPFLPDAVQFPKIWLLFGPARWCCKTTLFVNIWRLESSIWQMPDDPMNFSQWTTAITGDMSNWSIVVAPTQATMDTSPFAIIDARFKDVHTVLSPTFEDAQLTPTFRRYIDGDPLPEGFTALRNGALVVDIVDKSGWVKGTSFGGDIFSGLLYAIAQFTSDGYDDGTVSIPDPATFPSTYYEQGYLGSDFSVPSVVYRGGPYSMITSEQFIGMPPKDAQHVTGGHSMPGVNELISAAIQMAGDLIAMMIGIPPIGGATDAILAPLYTDVFLAFMTWKDTGRIADMGWSHYKETFAQGADRAYTISSVIALRTSLWATRNNHTHKITVRDGAPWIVGMNGYGHFYLGDRIGTTSKLTPGRIFVDRVSEITIKWDRNTAPIWQITVGQRKPFDPVLKAFQRIQAMLSAIHDLGMF